MSSFRGAGFQARNADILVGASVRPPAALWGSQSWLPPAFSRRVPGARDLFQPEEAAFSEAAEKVR